MLKNVRKIHCIGIGGIGVSALAQFFVAQGKEVTGYDDEIQNSKFEMMLMMLTSLFILTLFPKIIRNGLWRVSVEFRKCHTLKCLGKELKNIHLP